jgi:glutathione S-transferase
MRLYEYGRSRSTRCHWMLAELELEYESVTVDLAKGEQRRPQFLAINPYGKVPVLEDGDAVVTESAAICTWLAERYPEKNLIPPEGTLERAHYYQWTFFCMAELEPHLWAMRKHMLIYPKEKRSAAAVRLAREEYATNVSCLAGQIGNDGFVLGPSFNAADIIIGYNLLWAESLDLLGGHALLQGYVERLKQRPAFPHHIYGKA